MITTISILLALLAPQATAAPAVRKSSAPVSGIQDVIDLIKNNKPGKAGGKKAVAGTIRSFTFTESGLNAFVNQWIRQEAGRKKNKFMTVKSASVRLKDGHVLELSGVASFSAGFLKPLSSESDSFVAKSIRQYLTMDNSVEIECRVSSAKGMVFLKFLKLKVKRVPLPDALVQRTLKFIGGKQRPPRDLTKPFNLPDGIQKINILPQKLALDIKVL
jgi:hypothetical protein